MQIQPQSLPSAYPAVMPVLEKLGFVDAVQSVITKQWHNGVDHADALTVLILMILDSGGPRPLYDVPVWAEQFGIEALLGLNPAQLHHDKIGDTLDALVPVDDEGRCDLSLVSQLQHQLAHNAICRFSIATDVLHYDFTDVAFTGVHEASKLRQRGAGRGRRQFELGLNVTAEGGFPVLARAHPGATNHSVSVPDNLEALTRRLPGQSFCVVADAGGLNFANIRAYNAAGQQFVGMRQLQKWEKQRMAQIPREQFEPTEYKSQSGGRYWVHDTTWKLSPKQTSEEIEVRAVVVLSESKLHNEQVRARTVMRKLLERLAQIAEYAGGRGSYARPEYVREMAQKALKQHREAAPFVTIEVGDEPSLSWTVAWGEFARYRSALGRYALFTNKPVAEASAEEVLGIYRGRHVVETSYRHLKSELEIEPLHLRNDNRLYALVAVYVLALMVLSLLQILLRRAGLETKRGQALTARELLRHLKAVDAVALRGHEGIQAASVAPLSELAQRYLSAIGFPDPQHWLTVPQLDLPTISGT
jgi:transposase